MAADDKITDVLSEHTSLEKIQNGQKLKCALSGHEMPCRLDAINTYITGKKYKKLKAKSDQDKEDYMQHLEQKKGKKAKFGHSIYCKLTCRSLSDQPLHIKRHVEGRRFQKALARWKECQKTGEKFVPRQPMKRDAAMETDDRSSDGDDRSSDGDDRSSDGDDQSSEGEDKDEDEDAMGEDEDSMDDDDMDEDDGAMSDLYPSSDSEPADVEMITKGRARVIPQKADDQESEASDFDFDEIYRNAPVATQETDSEEEEQDSEGEDELKDDDDEEEEDDAEEAEAEEGSEESEEEKQETKPVPSKRKLKRMQFKMNKKARMPKKKKAQS